MIEKLSVGEREGGHSQSHTAALADAVRGYPMGIGLVKEFLQNADDAGASKLRVVFDRRRHPGPVAPDDPDALLDVALEPALLFINDAKFDEDDIKGIRRIGQSVKFRRASGTGRFGKGFCTAFSVSDHPSLVTGDDVMWFDPHRRAICSDVHSDKHAYMRRFALGAVADALPAWIGTFGVAGVERTGASFDGTAFRLPLRNADTATDSDVSHQCFDDSVWASIVESVRELGPALLVFLRSVESLTLSEVDETGSERVRLTIVTDNLPEVRRAREPLRTATDGETVALLKQWLEDPAPLPTTVFEHVFLVSDGDGEFHHEDWAVVTGLLAGPDNVLLEHAHQICTARDPDKVLPWAGAALCLQTTREGARLGGRSCFLPIGDQSHPPPVWIHGWFDLDDKRSHLTRDFGSDGDASNRGRWNQALLKHGVGRYWARLVEHLGLRLHEAKGGGYSHWAPPAGDQGHGDDAVSIGFYEAISELAVMRCRSETGHDMLPPNPAIRWVPRGAPPELVTGLMEDGWWVFDPRPPEGIRKGLASVGVELEPLSADDLRDHFFEKIGQDSGPWALDEAPCALLHGRDRLHAVWVFFAANDGDLIETPLCLTMDGKLRCFDESELVYACREEQAELLETLPHHRLHPDCQEALGLVDQVKNLGVSPIEISDIQEFAAELAERDGNITDDWAAAVLDELVRRPPSELEAKFDVLMELSLLPTLVGKRTPLGYCTTAAVDTGPAEAGLLRLLRRVCVPILQGSSRLQESSRTALAHYRHMMNELTPRFVARVLGGPHSEWLDGPTHAKRLDSLGKDDIRQLLNYLAGIRWGDADADADADADKEVKRKLRERLPLLTSQGDIIRASAEDLYRPVGVVPPPELAGEVTLLDVSGEDWDSLAEALGVPPLDDARLLMEQALPFLKSTPDEEAKGAVRAWVMREAPRVVDAAEDEQADELRKLLRAAPLLPLRGGGFEAATDSYQAGDEEDLDRLTKVLGPNPRVVVNDAPKGLSQDRWRSVLALLQVAYRPRPADILRSILDAIHNWQEPEQREAASERIRAIYTYLNNPARLESLGRHRMPKAAVRRAVELMSQAKNGSQDATSTALMALVWGGKPRTFIEVLRSLPWLPAQRRLWSSDEDDFQIRLYKPSELYRPGQRRLVSAVRPVLTFAEPQAEVRDLLGFASTGATEMEEAGDPGPVGEQLAALLRVNPAPLNEQQARELHQTVGVVYAELARLEDPKARLEQWDWPHAGQGTARDGIRVLMGGRWRAAQTVFFNSLELEPNPWIGSIAGWSARDINLQRLLLEAVGVRDQPTIEDWLRLLSELHSQSEGEPLTGQDLGLARRSIIKLAGRLRETGADRASGPIFVLGADDRLIESTVSFEIDSPRIQSLGERVCLPTIRRDEDNRRVALWGGAQPVSQVVHIDNPRGQVVEDYEDAASVRLLLALCRDQPAVWASVVARLRYHYATCAPQAEAVGLATLADWQSEATELSSSLSLVVYERLTVDLTFSGTDHDVLPVEESYFVECETARIHIVASELEFSLDQALARLCLGAGTRGPEAAEAGRTLMRVARAPEDARNILDRQNYLAPPDETEALANLEGQSDEDDLAAWEEMVTDEPSDDADHVDVNVEDDQAHGEAASLNEGATKEASAQDEASTGSAVHPAKRQDTPSPHTRQEGEVGEGSPTSDDARQPPYRQSGTIGGRRSQGGGASGSRSSWKTSPPHRTRTPGRSSATSDGTRTGPDSNRTSRPRDRMTSYVARADGSTNPRHRERHQWEAAADQGDTGEEAVVAYERGKGRCACQMPKGNPGYDIASSPTESEGLPDMDHPDARYIEVKSTKHGWDAYGVAISEPQFQMARHKALGPKWWLYVVEHVDTDEQVIHEVPNPLRDSGLQYRFDGGWAEWAARRREKAAAAPPPPPSPAQDKRVGKRYRQRQRTGKLWTFTVQKISTDRASGRPRARILLDSGQTRTIHNFEGWEPVE